MKYQMYVLRLALARRLRRPAFFLAVLGVILAALCVRFALAEPDAPRAVAEIGVVLPEKGAEEFFERLSERDSSVVTFVLTDEETLRRNVAVSRWDSGLILSEEYGEMLREGDLEEAVTLVTGPGSAVFPLVRETVAAVLAEEVSPVIAENYLRSKGIAFSGAWTALDPSQRVNVQLETLDGEKLDEAALAESSLRRVSIGTLAIVLLVWSMYTAIDLARRAASPTARRMMAVRSLPAQLFGEVFSELLLMNIISAAALTVAFGRGGLTPALMLVPYLAALGALALLLAALRGAEEVIPVVIPAAAAACFVLCPVVMDVTLLLPGLAGVVRWIPVTLYLSACGGDMGAAAALAAMAAASGTAAALVLRRRK